MDSLSKDLLDHIVEGLDTIKSRLERQNQEQAALNCKLSDVSNQLEEEKVFMRDQLQDAQNEVLRRLTELQTKVEEPRNPHGSSRQGVELRESTSYEAKGAMEHVLGAFSDEIAYKMERSVRDMIRKELEELNKHFRDSLDETQKNVGREVSRSTEIATQQLHESIIDFTERTKVELFAQTAGLDDKLGYIEASDEDLRRKMSTCEKKLATVERMTQQHVKVGILTAMNELKNSAVANIKPIFTKKSLIFLLLFSAVGLAVWYRSEGFTFTKSHAHYWMGNTKSEPDYMSRNEGNSNDNPQRNWNKEFINHFKDNKNQFVSITKAGTQQILDELRNKSGFEDIKDQFFSITKAGTQQILDELRNTPGFEDIKNQVLSITKAGTQQILDKLRNIGDTPCKAKSKKHDVEDIKTELVSITKEVIEEVFKHHSRFSSDIFGGTPGTIKLKQNVSKGTLNSSMEVVRSAERMKVMLQSLDREAEYMMKLLNVTTTSTSQQEGATFNETTNNASYYLYVTSAILNLVESIPHAIILFLSVAALFIWLMIEMTKSEIISATDKSKRDIISFTEKENQLVRDRIAGPLPSLKTYICDFYVENFKQLVKTGRRVTSLPWHINQFGTSVSGFARFQYNGKMRVWLIHGRNPREVGLEPKLYGRLKFKATITDTSGGLPDHVVGEKTRTMNGEYIKDNGYWGVKAGVVSCDKLIKKGYGKKEGYDYGALLIRYEITVV